MYPNNGPAVGGNNLPQAQPPQQAHNSFSHQNNKINNKFTPKSGLLCIYVVVLFLAVFLTYSSQHSQLVSTQKNLSSAQSQLSGINPPESHSINHSEYQAVFLNSGQVYFGKIAYIGQTYLKLTHIFYLQNSSTSSTNSSAANLQSVASNSSTGSSSLIKLGCELHAPEDLMVVNMSQVNFWENIRNSSEVTTAINSYYSKPAPTCPS